MCEMSCCNCSETRAKLAVVNVEWPAEVDAYYRQRATGGTDEAGRLMFELAETIRVLDASRQPRTFYMDTFPDGSRRLIEAALTDDDLLVAVKQIDVSPANELRRYWWQRVEDDDGFILDQPVNPAEDGLQEIDAASFTAVWQAVED